MRLLGKCRVPGIVRIREMTVEGRGDGSLNAFMGNWKGKEGEDMQKYSMYYINVQKRIEMDIQSVDTCWSI